MLHKRTVFRFGLGLLQLVRLANLTMIAMAQYLAAFFIVKKGTAFWEVITDPKMFALVFATVCIAASGYIINDYYDVKIDVINRPRSVIIDRILRRREAIGLHFILNAMGTMAALLVSKLIALLVMGASFSLFLYSSLLKRFPLVGNIMIGCLAGASIILPALHYKDGLKMSIVYAVFAGFTNVLREIVKDLEDMKGDAKHGLQTLPILYGMRTTKWVIYLFILIFVPLLFFLSQHLERNLVMYLWGMAIFVFYFGYKLWFADTRAHFAWLSSYCKFLMMVGMGSMLLI